MGKTRRDWSLARQKVQDEGQCRVCRRTPGPGLRLEAAHTIGRSHDQFSDSRGLVVVHPDDVVPLCIRGGGSGCHTRYDNRDLDLLPYLTEPEQAAAVLHVGIVSAYRRLTSNRESPT